MSFDQQLRTLIRDEVQAALAPLADQVSALQSNGDLTARLRSLFVTGGARGPAMKASARGSKAKGARKRGRPAKDTTPCAVIGCTRPSRSKGYCSAHYQKRRMLEKTKRLPSDWKEDAKPATVTDLVLPRGRAGAKALAEAKK